MNWAEILGVGGPFAGVAAVVSVILTYALRKRGSETGVVETTKATLGLMKEQQDALAETLRGLRKENEDLRTRLSLKDEQVETIRVEKNHLADQVEELRDINEQMRNRLDKLEGRADARDKQSP